MGGRAPFFFDAAELASVARAHAAEFASASPFPHVALDGLLPDDLLEAVVEEVAGIDPAAWFRRADAFEVKESLADEARLPPVTRQLLQAFNSAPFLAFLEELTGIEGLLADPALEGGGIHQIHEGGRLGVHADFDHHGRLHVDRRLNVLLYLNRAWPDAYGGHLELWPEDMSACARRIAPELNRMVVFATTATSFHGHPDPVRCPPDVCRRSLALYYYTASAMVREPRSTSFQARPGSHDVDLRPPRWRSVAKDLLPPVVVRRLRRGR